mmetsp:Transcript_33050/g.78307  ORF Transcript_33050/g.78307 Transcript_33050/m.78307 type:complete len:201 (+) Transcript_33050:1095-1697(+)
MPAMPPGTPLQRDRPSCTLRPLLSRLLLPGRHRTPRAGAVHLSARLRLSGGLRGAGDLPRRDVLDAPWRAPLHDDRPGVLPQTCGGHRSWLVIRGNEPHEPDRGSRGDCGRYRAVRVSGKRVRGYLGVHQPDQEHHGSLRRRVLLCRRVAHSGAPSKLVERDVLRVRIRRHLPGRTQVSVRLGGADPLLSWPVPGRDCET